MADHITDLVVRVTTLDVAGGTRWRPTIKVTGRKNGVAFLTGA
jgi:hypothetical protein